MKTSHVLAVSLLFLAVSSLSFAQVAPDGTIKVPIQPTVVDDSVMQDAGAQLQFDIPNANKMSADSRNAAKQGRVVSVPNFSSSFTFNGTVFPFTMVGRAPEKGGTTQVKTQIIPISLFFDGFIDANGNNIVIDVAPLLPTILNSPNFQNAGYKTGFTQFADAVQRAEFFSTEGDDWHTLLRDPKMLTPVQIEVPANTRIGQLFQTNGTKELFAVIDTGFFVSQLNTIIQLENLDVEALPIALTNRVFLGTNASINACCVVGFHTALDAGVKGDKQFVQTFAWASWAGTGIFGGTFQDVVAMSHEISEWANDPFINNATPSWLFPNSNTNCQSNLETGDPVEVFANAGFPVSINGFTYHPQTEALLQWFSRKSPSDAIDGAYSFPDETILTTPSRQCPSRP
jgi:hypothetical protein